MTHRTIAEIEARHAKHRKVMWRREGVGPIYEIYFEHCPNEDEGQRWQWVQAYHLGHTTDLPDDEAEELIEYVNLKEPA